MTARAGFIPPLRLEEAWVTDYIRMPPGDMPYAEDEWEV